MEDQDDLEGEAHRTDANGKGWVDAEKREQIWALMALFGIPFILLALGAVASLVLTLNPGIIEALQLALKAKPD